MKWVSCILVLFPFGISYEVAFSQCIEEITTDKNIPNEINYSLGKTILFSKEKHLNYLAVDSGSIDQNTDETWNCGQFRYLLRSADTSSVNNKPFVVYYLQDPRTNSTYRLGKGAKFPAWFNSIYFLRDCAVFIYAYEIQQRHIIVFNYRDKSTSEYAIPAYKVTGYSDSSVYFLPGSNFKYHKKKYFKNSTLSINQNGLAVFKKSGKVSDANPAIIFESADYKVEEKYLYTIKDGCIEDKYNIMRISYRNAPADSFLSINRNNGRSFVFSDMSDTLCIYEAEYPVFYNQSYATRAKVFRKYYKGNIAGKWDSNAWTDSLPVCNGKLSDFYNTGETLYIKFICSKDFVQGLSPDLMHTLNNVAIREEAKSYSLVLAFDLNSNSFIGYPEIKFISYLKPVNKH
jgi:hypothetical protein